MQKTTHNIACGPVVVNDVTTPQITGIVRNVHIGRFYFDFLLTNMGVSATIKSIAEIKGLKPISLNQRGKKYGYYHPLVLHDGYINAHTTKDAINNPVGPQCIGPHRNNPSKGDESEMVGDGLLHPDSRGIDYRKYCVREKSECVHYTKCLDGRVKTRWGITERWRKPEGDCYVPSDSYFVNDLYSQGQCKVHLPGWYL